MSEMINATNHSGYEVQVLTNLGWKRAKLFKTKKSAIRLLNKWLKNNTYQGAELRVYESIESIYIQ
jgi:hypothetical protein